MSKTKAEEPPDAGRCEECGGTGKEWQDYADLRMRRPQGPCPACNGTGRKR